MGLVSVITPALNEGPTLVELYERTKTALDDTGRDFEFIFVDDGSSDETSAVTTTLNKTRQNVTVIRHATNHGKSIALMQGFDVARGDVAVILDADLQDKPEMIPRLLDKIDEGFDLVNGKRIRRQDKISRKFVSRIYNWFISKAFGCHLEDVNCGLKAMRRDVYKSMELYGDLHRLIPVLAEMRAFKTTELPVEHDERRVGKSKYRLLRHRGILDVIALFAINATETRPFHFFCEIAFAFWVMAFVALGLWIAIVLGIVGPLGRGWEIFGTVLGGVGTWAAFVGTVLPLFGFFQEVESRRLQDPNWRHVLVKETLRSGDA